MNTWIPFSAAVSGMVPIRHYDLMFCLRRIPRKLKVRMLKSDYPIFIGGGFIRSVVSGEPVNDIDVFVDSKEHTLDLANILSDGDKSRIHDTPNAYTIFGYKYPIQIIHRWVFPTAKSVAESFDFTVCCAVIYKDSSSVLNGLCDGNFYPDLAAKRLVYRSPIRNEDAGGSMLRVLKYYQRGYRIPLDSLGAIISRLAFGVKQIKDGCGMEEDRLARILTGLLVEVDPQEDLAHLAHLPSIGGGGDDSTEE